jgi:hypothetical protein
MTPEEFKTLQKQAEDGDTNAMILLAFAYYEGGSTERDLKQYFAWLKNAAEANNIIAMPFLALAYRDGEGTEKNPQLFFVWMKKAAEAGYVFAMSQLALAYREGVGTNKNPQLFFEWIQKAAEAGSPDASLPARVFAEISSKESDAHGEIVDQLWALLGEVSACKEKHLVARKEGQTVAHFTEYTTIEKMLPLSKEASQPEKNKQEEKHTHFRLYNTEYLNDPDEGRALFQFLKEKNKDLYKTLFDGLAEDSFLQSIHDTLSVYTCSFSTETDRLDLWRAYGKDGNGVSIVTPTLAFNKPQLGQDNLFSSIDRAYAPKSDTETSSTEKLWVLYHVRYLNQDKAIGEGEPNEANVIIKPVLDALAGLKPCMEKLSDDNDKNKLRKAILIALSDILYLYKHKEYENEKEVRLIDAAPIDSRLLHMDERSPGRLFIKTRDIVFQNAGSKVVIGPKVEEKVATELNCKFRLARHKLQDNVTVEHSKIHYR